MSTLTTAPSTFAAAWMAITREWFSASGSSKAPHQESATELLRRADAYALTQPGFAADLRAAAQRMTDPS